MRLTLTLQLILVLTVVHIIPCMAIDDIAVQGIFVPATDRHIEYIGRTCTDPNGHVFFSYPGTQAIVSFSGTSLKMAVKPRSGHFMVQVDDEQPRKVSCMAEPDSIVSLAESLAHGNHTARIMYVVEGYELHPAFRGFIIDAGSTLTDNRPQPARKIEFIGDSMTCGYGNEDEDPKSAFSYDTENHYLTYAAITARHLNAQHVVVARSGIGIYRNWGQPLEGSPDAMPALYDRTLFYDSTYVWDYSRYTPQVVCINLGTNDTSQNRYDTSLMETAYKTFVRHIRTKYPEARIVLLSGSMLSGKPLADVKAAMDRAVAALHADGDDEVYRFDMSPQDGSLGYGANYHPSLRQHDRMAAELTAFLRTIMLWQ